MMVYSPSLRISARDALDHPYFTGAEEVPRPIPAADGAALEGAEGAEGAEGFEGDVLMAEPGAAVDAAAAAEAAGRHGARRSISFFKR